MKKITKLRRIRQQLSDAECEALLMSASSGVLSLVGEDGYPYAVPLSFVYHEGTIYFHTSTKGEKMEAMKHDNKASFCVIAKDDVVPSKFTTRYQSVVSFGTVRLVDEFDEQLQVLHWLADKYSPGELGFEKEVADARGHLSVIAMDIELMTGKQGRELMSQKQKKQ